MSEQQRSGTRTIGAIHWRRLRLVAELAIVAIAVAGASIIVTGPADARMAAPSGTIDAPLRQLLEANEKVTFWVELRDRAELSGAPDLTSWDERGAYVAEQLADKASDSQAGVVAVIEDAGAAFESFWITNAVRVEGTESLAEELAARPDVAGIHRARTLILPEPAPTADAGVDGVGWNVHDVRADEVWSDLGVRGEGIVVANIDTGVQFDHPALVGSYRGNNGGTIDHNYNWFDPSRVCGSPSTAPCDNNGHGTHTMGTMVGDDGGANQIGVAPGARWIAAKGCESNSCSDAALIAAGQWLLAPTDLTGANPRPDLRPNIINNSWGGGGGDFWYRDIVDSWVAAGIFPVFSNGNSGSSCGSAGSPGDYPAAYSVGAYDAAGTIAGFSSRGPGPGGEIKPNISAPGVNVRSSVPGNAYAGFNGTSMAAPHVAGVVALMWSASPAIRDDVSLTRTLLDQSAVDVDSLTCGGTSADNNTFGEGRLDAVAAVLATPRGLTGTLEGVVTATGTGGPVAGAAVEATVGSTSIDTTTDGAGAYRLTLPIGDGTVTASSFGTEPDAVAMTILEGMVTTVDLTLTTRPAHTVSGVVRRDGAPAVGATLSFLDTPIPPAITDAEGAFAVAGVPDGTYRLLVTPAVGCAKSRTLTVELDGGDVDLDVQLPACTFRYSAALAQPTYIEASAVLGLSHPDDGSADVQLPFAFPFDGGTFNSAAVSTNGFITLSGSFDARSTFGNTALPAAARPNAAVYAFWDDLIVDELATVRTEALGIAPHRRFVIEWRNVRSYDGSERFDAEIVLDEDGRITTQYRGIDDSPRERGASATLGIENLDGTGAVQFSFNQPSIAVGSMAIVYEPDRGELSVSDVTVTEGDAGVARATFTVTRTRNLIGPAWVDWTTTDGTATAPADYAAVAPTTLAFADGEHRQRVTVDVVGDTAVEGDETFGVALSNPVAASIGAGSATATVIDDDTALAIGDVAVVEGDGAPTTATFTVTRSGVTTGSSTVSYATADGTAGAPADYLAASGTLTFGPGETARSIDVAIAGETAIEADETFTVDLSAPAGATITDGSATGTILSDDSAVAIDDVAVAEGSSGTTLARFTLTRSGATSGTSSVRVRTSNRTAAAPSDYVAVAPTVVTFGPGETTKGVDVTINGDSRIELTETFTVELDAPAGTTISDRSGVGTIQSDELLASLLTIDDVTIVEGHAGTATATFTVTRTGYLDSISTVSVATQDVTAKAPGDYAAVTSSTLTFAPGVATATVAVAVTGDTGREPAETFLVSLSRATGTVILDPAGRGTIRNDD